MSFSNNFHSWHLGCVSLPVLALSSVFALWLLTEGTDWHHLLSFQCQIQSAQPSLLTQAHRKDAGWVQRVPLCLKASSLDIHPPPPDGKSQLLKGLRVRAGWVTIAPCSFFQYSQRWSLPFCCRNMSKNTENHWPKPLKLDFTQKQTAGK